MRHFSAPRPAFFTMPSWSTLPAWVMVGAFSLTACAPDTGACAYTEARTDCAQNGLVCDQGRCVTPGACDGVVCDAPPAAECRGFRAITFVDGACDAACTVQERST